MARHGASRTRLKRTVDRADNDTMDSEPSGHQLLQERLGRRNITMQVVRMFVGLTAAFVVARSLVELLFDTGANSNGRLAAELSIHLVLSLGALTVSSVIPVRNRNLEIAEIIANHQRHLQAHAKSQGFHRDVQQAFDMAETEDALFNVAGDALAVAHAGPAEILVADSSQSHIDRTTVGHGHDAPGCGVSTPGSCPAVQRGQALDFDDPNGLAACPRLRERGLADGVRATCIPIAVLGAPTAVLHALQEAPVDGRELEISKTQLEDTAVTFGARLGMIRAMKQSQLQADTDPLTGLLNRRATENLVRGLRRDDTPFAVAMADLDHFKQLNDTYGHDTGDRALRLFTRVLQTTVRDSDIVCRHGGEEFVIILPGATVITAAPVLHRLRERLAEAVGSANVPSFTTSLGLADSTTSLDFQEILDAADQALMRAKAEGRDRLVVGESAAYDTTSLG